MKSILLAGTALVSLASGLHAQTVDPNARNLSKTDASRADATVSDPSDIIVTGSRIVRNGYTAPTPVTVATTDDLVKTTPSNIPDGLNKLPQFANSQSPSRSALNFANAPIHGNVLNLRGIGPTRTLILFDGIRAVPTTFVGTVDINVFPNLLIERVEVVTGGASAAYGSDAVSGVVNFVLNKKFTGITGVAQAGISERGDNANQRIGLAYGTRFAGGRGHLLLSGEYFNNEGMRRNQRAYGRTGLTYVGSVIGCVAPVGALANYCSPGGQGNPYIAKENAVLTSATPFGKISASSPGGNPFINYVFNADGTYRPFQAGAATGNGPSVNLGGDGFTIPFDNTAIAPLKTYQGFGRLSFDVTPDVTIFAQGNWSRADVKFTSLANSFENPNSATLFKGNPFIPAAIDATIPVGGNITVRQYMQDGPKPTTHERTNYWMGTAGLEGKFGGGLKWDASYTHGESKMNVAQSGTYDIKKAYAALDAVVAQPGNPGGIATGTISCNVLANEPDPAVRAQYSGCQPINVLGAGPWVTTPAGYAYATGTSRYQARLKQDSLVANLSGKLIDLPAGPVSFAVGAEYRHQSLGLDSNANPALLNATSAAATAALRNAYFAGLRGVPSGQLFYYSTNVGTARGKVTVKEAYGELAVPILKDVPLFQELSLNGAGRITDYSTSGTVKTWKLGATWKPVQDLLFRGTLSRDIRAPNLYELFAGIQNGLTAVSTPGPGNTTLTQTVVLANRGNPALQPERSKAVTLGGVLSPRLIPGLSLSVDYFRMKVTGLITTLPAQQIVTNCVNNANAVECGLITRDSASLPIAISVAPTNSSFLTTRGLDFDSSYRALLGDVKVALRLYASRLLKYETQQYAGIAPLNLTGLSLISGNPVGYPKWRGAFSGDFGFRNFGLTLSEQYIGKLTAANPSVVRPTPTTSTQFNAYFVNSNIKPVWYTDLTLRFDVPRPGGRNFELFGTVNNLFDKQPPMIPGTIVGNNLPTNLSLYDTIGRSFTAGVRFKL
ncbi:MAG: TonB-dependent receptor [Sphingomicrobium sp.]